MNKIMIRLLQGKFGMKEFECAIYDDKKNQTTYFF